MLNQGMYMNWGEHYLDTDDKGVQITSSTKKALVWNIYMS
jgi:hypothetical protein